ncbi:MAG: dihydrodipicolinate reductase [Floccifex porci]|uniref:NAD(P)H-dependent amine dehydrogenase family protein n=1 Tax=Floccifex porci TaxID=2606629 RepID=UPI003F0E4010
MERKITFVQYGCGKMAKYLIRYAIGKGAVLLGAFDMNPAVIGKDAADIVGDGYPETGIKVSAASEAERMIADLKPDVCIIATRSTVAELENIFTICAKNGVNAITTCEEALYPWNSSPDLTKKLDALAKEGNCTLTGVGYCDLYWGTMVTNYMGSQYTVNKIIGESWYNVEDYGIALAQGHGAGLSIEEFNKTIGAYNDYDHDQMKAIVESGEYVPSYMWNQNGWLASKLGLHIVSQTQKCIPTTYPEDLYSSTLGRVIPAGQATGMKAIVTTTTEEGITLETACVGKVYSKDEYDINQWTLQGEPDSTLICNKPATVELTCGTIINRIPQLIDAPAGYITTDQYPYNLYCIKDLNEYVTSK